MLTEVETAYVAGFSDGEGCFQLRKSSGNRKDIFAKFTIGLTYLPTLEWLKSYYGGAINPHGTNSPNWKPAWKWTLSSFQSRTFVEDIYPYLREKKNQADIMLAYFDWRDLYPAHTGQSSTKIPWHEVQWMVESIKEMKKGHS